MAEQRTVVLPAKPYIHPSHVGKMFRVSRESIRLWRRDRNFPVADEGLLKTQQVATWALRNNWIVEWR